MSTVTVISQTEPLASIETTTRSLDDQVTVFAPVEPSAARAMPEPVSVLA